MEQNKIYTAEEYLALELVAEGKSEYYDGKILPMEGHTQNQDWVASDCLLAIYSALNDEEWSVFGSTLKIRVDNPRTYFYPEVSVIHGQPLLEDNDYSFTNPTLIVEVLAERSESFDRRKKINRYKLIPSFEEYVLIAHDIPHVEVYRRGEDGRWNPSYYSGLEDEVKLQSLGIQVKLADIYRRVEFEKEVNTFMVLDFHSERAMLAQRILMVEDARVLHEIQLFVERLLQAQEGGISIDQYNAEIDQAVLDMKNGLGTTHDALKREREKW